MWQDLVGGDPAEWYKEEGGGGFGSGEQYNQLSVPVMFAFHKRDMVGNKASLKIADSKWSKVRLPFFLRLVIYDTAYLAWETAFQFGVRWVLRRLGDLGPNKAL